MENGSYNSVNNLFVLQTALLVLYHGFNINMPWWVVWFPFVAVIMIAFFIIVAGALISITN